MARRTTRALPTVDRSHSCIRSSTLPARPGIGGRARSAGGKERVIDVPCEKLCRSDFTGTQTRAAGSRSPANRHRARSGEEAAAIRDIAGGDGIAGLPVAFGGARGRPHSDVGTVGLDDFEVRVGASGRPCFGWYANSRRKGSAVLVAAGVHQRIRRRRVKNRMTVVIDARFVRTERAVVFPGGKLMLEDAGAEWRDDRVIRDAPVPHRICAIWPEGRRIFQSIL